MTVGINHPFCKKKHLSPTYDYIILSERHVPDIPGADLPEHECSHPEGDCQVVCQAADALVQIQPFHTKYSGMKILNYFILGCINYTKKLYKKPFLVNFQGKGGH